MYKNKSTGYYEADFRRPKVADRLHVSYGTKKKDEALRLHAAVVRLYKDANRDAIEALRDGRLSVGEIARLQEEGKPLLAPPVVAADAPTPWPTVRDAADQYLDWLTANPRKQAGTHRTAKSIYDRFLAWLGTDADRPLDQIPTSRVSDYQTAMIRDKLAINTVTISVWRVGTIWRWHRDREVRLAQEEKRAPRFLHVPLDPDSVSTARTHRTRYLTEQEAERLLAACPGRLLCPVAIGLFAGLRIDEVMHLRPAFDVDLELGLLTIQEQPGWRPKSGKRRFVPIAAPLKPLLEQHLERYASEEWLVPSSIDPTRPQNPNSFTTTFRRIVADAELIAGRSDPKGVVFHTLRHTFASWLAGRGVDLYTIAQLLGNSLKVVEDTYAHLSPDFKAAAIGKLAGVVAVPALPGDEADA